MTPQELEAIRARDAADLTIAWDLTGAAWREAFRIVALDRRALLAEVDRLTERGDFWRSEFDRVTAENQTMLSAMLSASRNETTQWVVARIRAAVEGLPDTTVVASVTRPYAMRGEAREMPLPGAVDRAAVLAAIDGEEPADELAELRAAALDHRGLP